MTDKTPAKNESLLHELQARLAELEAQNAELAAARARYFDLYQQAPVGYLTLDEAGLILEANLTAATLLGMPLDALIGHSFFQFVLSEDWDACRLRCERLFATGQPQSCELQLLKPEEERFWARLEATVAQREDDGPVCRCVISDVTAYKETDLRLRQLSTAVEQSPVSIVITDAGGAIEYVNPKFTQLTGYTLEEVRGQNPRVLKSGELPAQVYEELWQTITAGGEWQGELYNRKKNGECYWETASISPLFDATGRITHFVGVKEDITERKWADEALRESEARYRDLAASIPGAIYQFHIDCEGAYTVSYMSDGAEHLFERPLSELTDSRLLFSDVHPDDLEGLQQSITEAARQRCRWVHEFRIVLSEGRIKWLRASSNPGQTAEGGLRWNGVLLDITERRQAELALRRSEAMLQRIFEILPVGLWFTDAGGKLLRGNPAGIEIWGAEPLVPPSEYGVFKARRLPGREEIAPEEWALAHTIREHRVITDEVLEIDAFDGQKKIILNYTAPVLDDTGELQGAIVVNVDITARKRAEEQLEHYAAELQRSNQDLQQFAYVASHDLQEPLRTISGFARLLAERYQGQLDEPADEFIIFILEGVGRMRDLLQSLLAYSRVGSHELRPYPVKVGEVLRQVMNDLHVALAESDTEITHDPLPTVWADPVQLAQLLQNLIGNAIKFRGAAPVHIHISAECRHDRWKLSVSDSGIGIEPQYHEAIFEPFRRLHTAEQYPGTGMGLPICKRIIARHGGRIWVESVPGRGSTFYFTLPVPSGRA